MAEKQQVAATQRRQPGPCQSCRFSPGCTCMTLIAQQKVSLLYCYAACWQASSSLEVLHSKFSIARTY